MIKDEKKILRLLDLGIYLIFVPVILVLTPADKLIEYDPYFVVLMMIYMVVVHTINRRFNFVTYIFKAKYQKSILSLLSIALVTYLVTLIKVDDLRSPDSVLSVEDVANIRMRVLSTLCFIDVSFTTMLALVFEISRQKIERQDIETEKDKAELAVYKSQINPHFMFNTLNTIYALNFTQSPNTGEVIMKFSNIVKYMYQNSNKETIMILDEVKYLKEYIDLHTLRLGEQTKVNYVCEIDDFSQSVPSMILITFVENVFKYGVSSSEESDIDITIRLAKRELEFITVNSIFSKGENDKGIGIENCRKRLSLLYPNRYSLECNEDDNKYRTTLNIKL